MTASWPAGARPALQWAAASTLRINLLITLLGLLLFGAVHATSGRVPVNDGTGWDGSMYAQMTRMRLVDGNVPTQTRPLVPLLARVPYRAGLPVIAAYQVVNVVSAFALYLLTCLVLDHYRVGPLEKAFFVATLALSIATGRMFAFYPVLVDLGGLAVLMLATYAVLARGAWTAAAAIVLAVTAREFAAALAILMLVRSIRRRRDVIPALVSCVAAVGTVFLIRSWVLATNVGDPTSRLQTGASLLSNLEFLRDPWFVAFFTYFLFTLIGGITLLLAGRALWCLKTLVIRPELGIYTAMIVATAAAGNADIWRYLVFLLPVVVILFGRFVREYRPPVALLAAALVLTLVTQQSFGTMTLETYFRDWFPYYRVHDSSIDAVAFGNVWFRRFLLTAAGFVVLTLLQLFWPARRVAPADPAAGLAG